MTTNETTDDREWWERNWKDAVMYGFKHLPEDTEENLGQYTR
jgi:hypothetical protein